MSYISIGTQNTVIFTEKEKNIKRDILVYIGHKSAFDGTKKKNKTANRETRSKCRISA